MRIALWVALGMFGCDAGRPPAPAPANPPEHAPRIFDAAVVTKSLIGTEPGTLGPAFDGLALGQQIEQRAATAWLKERGIDATAYVRDGRLVSINFPYIAKQLDWVHGHWQHWFVPALHQHATLQITEHGEFLQFDLEVPIDRWIDATVGSVVPLDLVKKPLDKVEGEVHLVTHSNYVDGRAHVSWVDSALAGAETATEVSVREFHSFDTGSDVLVAHDVHVELEATPEVYAAIEQRLGELFGEPRKIPKGVAWGRTKVTLEHTTDYNPTQHIELTLER